MDVAITGASGLIGTALRAALEARGDRVVPVVRGRRDGLHWDPAAGTIDADGFEGIDAVVNLAGEGIGEKRWSQEQQDRIRDSRVVGTSMLATTLADRIRPPSVLVSGSAIGWYGDRDDGVAHGGEPTAFAARLPGAGVSCVGGGDHAGERGRHPDGAPSDRDRPEQGRRHAREAAHAVQARSRRPPRPGNAVHELDLDRRRGRRDPPRDRHAGARRPREPDCAEPGDQPRVHRRARAPPCTGRPCCRRRCSR